ncbi:hypothetical protein ES705_28660 [subsurface metagenome]
MKQMFNLASLLGIQILILFLIPSIKWLLSKISILKNEKPKFTLGAFLSANVIFTISYSIIFLVGYFKDNDLVPSKFEWFKIGNFSFEIGFNVSLLQILFYFVVMVSVSIFVIYYEYRFQLWQRYLEVRLPYLLVALIFFIFSPNIFQLLLSLLVIESLLIEVTRSRDLNNESDTNHGIRHTLFTLILSNIFIFTSSILLLSKTMSFDFQIIQAYLSAESNLYTSDYYKVIAILFFIGIIAKTSLFPFHSWKNKVCESESHANFIFLIIYFPLTLFAVLSTPLIFIIKVIPSFITWYTIVISLIPALFIQFIQEEKELLRFESSVYIGLTFFAAGIGSISSAFHMLLVYPIVFGIMIIFSSLNNEKLSQVEETTNIKFLEILRMSNWFLAFIVIIGVAPLNSIILAVSHSLETTEVAFPPGLFAIGLLLLSLLFSSNVHKTRSKLKSLKRIDGYLDVVVVSTLSTLLILLTLIFPIFNLLPLYSVEVEAGTYILATVISLVILFLIILVMHVIIPKKFTQLTSRMTKLSFSVINFMRKVYYFDFMFRFFKWFYEKSVIPVFLWVNMNIVEGFIIGFLYMYISVFLSNLVTTIEVFLTKSLFPKVKRFFIKFSVFLRRFEKTTIKNQILVIFSFLALMICIFLIILYVGE